MPTAEPNLDCIILISIIAVKVCGELSSRWVLNIVRSIKDMQ